jgi:hypothetical protein
MENSFQTQMIINCQHWQQAIARSVRFTDCTLATANKYYRLPILKKRQKMVLSPELVYSR